MPLISFDFNATDVNKAKAAAGSAFDWVEEGVVTPGNVDKYAFDAVKNVALKAIENLYAQGPLVVGGPPQNPATFLGTFQGVTPENAAFIQSHPEVITMMTATRRNGKAWFSHAEQEAMLQGIGGIDWMDLLMTALPILVKILLAMFL